ncbi:MAG: hypothetical protein ACQEQV_03575 [Fibrobacterota bacterium]
MKRILLTGMLLIPVVLLGGCLFDTDDTSEEKESPAAGINIITESRLAEDSLEFEGISSENVSAWRWRLNDDDLDATGRLLTRAFDAGEYTLDLQVVADGLASDWKSISFTIVGKGVPAAKLTVTPSSPLIGDTLHLAVSNVGDGRIDSVYWQVGGLDTVTAESDLMVPLRDPKWKGEKDIRLVLRNDMGNLSDTLRKSITITESEYIVHRGVKASTFWCGEGASSDNGNISNFPSAWDSDWAEDFGLEDHPTDIDRDSDFIPTSKDFTGNQNPYYVALPYNDFTRLHSEDTDGNQDYLHKDSVNGQGRKHNAYEVIPWAAQKDSAAWGNRESMCKNRWVRISMDGIDCYAQWEDAGPYYYNDYEYVFGDSFQSNSYDLGAGIDLSPSVMLRLGVSLNKWGNNTTVDWQFVDSADVPDGPWKKHVTTNQIDW